MFIIRRIEIKYFRSIYTTYITKCGFLNVFSGKNDVGKSNIIRALNLFFNASTDWNSSLNFYQDFSKKRLEQVRKETVKGRQFISIKLEFNRPPHNFEKSLPVNFSVTRTWHRGSKTYDQTHNLDSLQSKGKLPGSIETAKRFLPLFLNRIHFEYVPAVKDREYFSHLLMRLQKNLLDIPLQHENPITTITENLADHIQGQIGELQQDFQRATSLTTEIEPPNVFSALFQAFSVSTKSGETHIPLSLRGDGIQARYVPSVLHYISEKSKDFFIWGFEEPENSLEYGNTESLASDFEKIYSKHSQIFVTTHSPAFTSLRGEQTCCYRVYKIDEASDAVQVSQGIKENTEKQLLEVDIGYLEIQQKVHNLYREEIKGLTLLKDKVDSLQRELKENQLPLVLVEGELDKKILDTAWRKLFTEEEKPFIIRVADPIGDRTKGGSGGAPTLAKMLETIHPDDGRKVLGILDNDEAGVAAYDKISKNFKKFESNDEIKRSINGYSFAMLLPVLPKRKEYKTAKNLCIEFFFDDDTLLKKNQNNIGLEFEGKPAKIIVGNKQVELEKEKVNEIQQLLGNLSCYRKIISGKDIFANEIVPGLEREKFFYFLPLFYRIKYLLDIQQ